MKLTSRQEEAQQVLTSDATNLMLFGGSRSGKTFLHTRNTVMRAVMAPGSRHLIARFRFNHVKNSIISDTFPTVMKLAFPGVSYRLDKTDWYAELGDGAQVWFAGLDDKERTEKILGQEYVTIYLNECSQIPFASRELAMTRLAQLVMTKIKDREPRPLQPRFYYDCNPPNKAHWTYKLFVEKRDPDTGKPLPNPEDYAKFQINPGSNTENLSAGYLKTLQGMSARMRKRFLDGEFADANPNGLFQDEDIEKWRVLDGVVPDMVRVVIAVDPSGSGDTDNADNDAIGIVAAGLGTDGNAYVLEDVTVKAGPATWGKVATNTWERLSADLIVGEINYGGAMVKHVIQTARPRTPFKVVTATRGKVVRAEPFSALYEQGKVRHVGYFLELEDELAAFSTNGYIGAKSPNRADALIWALTELFPAIVTPRKVKKAANPQPMNMPVAGGWMGA
jgi:phage terminase large subunit-like protein